MSARELVGTVGRLAWLASAPRRLQTASWQALCTACVAVYGVRGYVRHAWLCTACARLGMEGWGQGRAGVVGLEAGIPMRTAMQPAVMHGMPCALVGPFRPVGPHCVGVQAGLERSTFAMDCRL